MGKISAAPACSEPIKLGTGLILNGALVDTVVLRILTRGDYRAAAKKTDEEERRNFLTARAIVKLGSETNQDVIQIAMDSLTETDEQIIIASVEKLKLDALKRSGITLESEPFIPVCDVWSEPFELNPGIIIEEEAITSCCVRLLTKGQWRAAANAGGENEQSDKLLFFSIAKLGHYTEIKEDWVDSLTEPDVDRINDQMEALRARARDALSAKSPDEGTQPE